MKRLILALLLLSPSFLLADDETENTGAVWTEVSVTKALPYNLSIEGSLEHRTIDWFDWSSRVSVGAGLNYKVNKYLKLGLSYTFIEKHFQQEVKDHYSSSTGKYNGYNVTNPYWIPRHRVSFDVVGSVRFDKTYRFTLRERYQYTHQASKTVERIKYRSAIDSQTGETIYAPESDEWEDNYKVKSAKNRHLLRSRLKFSIDKKGCKWEPYVSIETHNDFASKMHLDKIRTIVGVDYSIKKGHKIGVGYVFNHENDDDGNYNIHAISIGYNYKF